MVCCFCGFCLRVVLRVGWWGFDGVWFGLVVGVVFFCCFLVFIIWFLMFFVAFFFLCWCLFLAFCGYCVSF